LYRFDGPDASIDSSTLNELRPTIRSSCVPWVTRLAGENLAAMRDVSPRKWASALLARKSRERLLERIEAIAVRASEMISLAPRNLYTQLESSEVMRSTDTSR
jgi:hypothetical protein